VRVAGFIFQSECCRVLTRRGRSISFCEDGELVLCEGSFQARTAPYPAASAFFDLGWPRRKELRQWDWKDANKVAVAEMRYI
jgi:hypothetical protein